MKSFCAQGAALATAIAMLCAARGLHAEEPGYSVPSLLPLPNKSINYPATSYPAASAGGAYTTQPARPRSDGYGVATTSGSYPAARRQSPSYYDIAEPADDPLPQAAGGEAAGNPYHGGYDHHGPYADAMTAPYGGGCSTCGNNPCECGGGCWYGGLGGLIMTRDGENEFQLSSRSDNFNATVLSTRFADMDWAGGAEVYIGRYLGECWALEGVYWGVYPETQLALAVDGDGTAGNGVGDLITSFDLNLDFDDGLGGGPGVVNDWFDGAELHGLRRQYEIHNVELNLRRLAIGGMGCGPCSSCRWRASWLAGVRFFRYDENFDYFSDLNNTVITGAPDEVHYTIDVTNDLIGVQVGGDVEYLIMPRLSASLGTKFGLYGNRIDHRSRIGSSAGPATVAAGPNAGTVWDISSEKDDVAFLGEVAVALHYQISGRWSARAGYRALALTGVAFPSAQIPNNFEDVFGVEQIDSNGSMILHGAFLGVEYNY